MGLKRFGAAPVRAVALLASEVEGWTREQRLKVSWPMSEHLRACCQRRCCQEHDVDDNEPAPFGRVHWSEGAACSCG